MFYQNINWALLLNELSLKETDLKIINKPNWFLSFSGGGDSVLVLIFLILYHIQYPANRSLTIYFLNHNDQNKKEEKRRYVLFNFFKKQIREIDNLHISWLLCTKDVEKISKRLKSSFEFTAARIRKKTIKKISIKNPEMFFFTGHNLTDWFETLITRLNRGVHPEKLRPFSFFQNMEGYYKVCPLYLIDRNRIRSILNDTSIPYWNDPQNNNPAYYRNRIRMRIQPDNIPGLKRSALNFLIEYPNMNFSFLIEKYQIVIIDPGYELRIKTSILNSENAQTKERIIQFILRYLGMLPLSSCERKRFNKIPYHYPPFHIEIENWSNVYYYIFRRGKYNFLNYKVKKNQIRSSNITKKAFIQLKYGKKSVKKILSEKKISERQRFNLILTVSEKNPLEIINIPLSIFGLKDIYQSK